MSSLADKPTTAKILAFSLLPVLVVAGLVGTGFVLGRWDATRHFHRVVERRERTETLGGMLAVVEDRAFAGWESFTPEQAARAFYDPARALAEMDGYAWFSPTVRTPFVNNNALPGRHASAEINGDQFRWDREVTSPKPAGTYRIFLVGGSTAFSVGAPDNARTIGGYLERMLADQVAPKTGRTYEVITAAYPMWATTHERIEIENRVSEMEPDLVVALSGYNDVVWGAKTRDVLHFWTQVDHYFQNLLDAGYDKAGIARLPEVEGLEATRVPPETVAARAVKNVRLAAFALRPTGARYLWCLQPHVVASHKGLSDRERAFYRHYFGKLGEGSEAYYAAGYAALARAMGAEDLAGARFEDLTGIFDDLGPTDEVFLDSVHFGDRGNDLVARAIFGRLGDLP
ncbi:MAG: hypothetical protein KC466_17915 [Myxococcales bacterium]|nr:hypothetical protein [Myxococcales bacterium]